MKTFSGELVKFRDLLRTGTPFTLSRYGDGEWSIIEGRAIDILKKANGEFKYTPGDPLDEASRKLLQDSFTHRAPNYYVGIGCPCCMGEKHGQMRQRSGQDEEHLTFANVLVNGNYRSFVQDVAPLLLQRTFLFVCHKDADPKKLPFQSLQWHIKTTPNAWRDCVDGIETVKAQAGQCSGKVFLFAAGPFANMLAAECNKVNPENTYIDLGSVLDPWLFQGTGVQATRGYLAGAPTLEKICTWSSNEKTN